MLQIVYVFLIISVFGDASTKKGPYDYYRLPTALQPERYRLRIITHLENPKDFIFTGEVQIEFVVLASTKNITLHARKLVIDEAKIRVEGAFGEHSVAVKDTEVNTDMDYYIIKLNENLQLNTRYVLIMQFAGELRRSLRGYYVSSYVDKSTNETRYLSVTQFEPAHARTAFPCFDEPNLKATFAIILGHQKNYQAMSNMPLKETSPIYDRSNWQWSIFEESVPMSTYLVAYTLNDFSSVTSVSPSLPIMKRVKFRTWARAEAIDQCTYAAEIAPKILAFYEKTFGMKYPLPKLDQIAIPDFSAGAMENWGLVTYREAALLYSNMSSSLPDKQRTSGVIAHELAHQWFGNLVTMKWWTDLWLNEGFATYMASLGVEHLNPSWRLYEEESFENTLIILNLDAFACSHRVSQKIEQPHQIAEIFDAISYKKGAVVIRMMSMFMGKPAFQSGISKYVNANAYKNADQNSLWSAMTQTAHEWNVIPRDIDLKLVMDSWTLQTGYPLVTVIRNYVNNTAELRQKRYMHSTEVTASGTAQRGGCWFVPLTYTASNSPDFDATKPKLWLQCNEQNESIPLILKDMPNSQDWILFNIQLSGLYRVNYDDNNWRSIIGTLLSPNYQRIHVINRAQLIDDVFNLAWSGHRDYAIVFELLEYMPQEYEFVPWKAALENLNVIDRILRQSADYEYFRNYMQYLLQPAYRGILAKNDSSLYGNNTYSKLPRRLLITNWACRFEVDDCVMRAMFYFKKWKESPRPHVENPVPKNMRTIVYCTSLRYGSVDDWTFLWSIYQNSNVASEKKIIISALGCTREVWLLNRYLSWAYNDNSYIRKQDSVLVFNAISRSDIGYHVAKDYFISNIENLHKFYDKNSMDLTRLMAALSMQMSTSSAQKQLQSIINQHSKLFKSSERGIHRSLETVQLQLQWRERNYFDYTQRLKQRRL